MLNLPNVSSKTVAIFLAAVLLLFGLGNNAQAKQLYFNKQYIGANIRFQHQWIDMLGQHQTIKFSLPIDDIERGKREFKRIDNRKTQEYVYKKLLKYAQEKSRANMKITVRRDRNGVQISVKGNVSQQVVNDEMLQLKNMQRKFMEEYITNNWYRFIDEKTIIPDHKRITKRYVYAMSPVAKAMMGAIRGKNRREKVNYVLSFLQSIPYDTLQNRYTSNGAGFQTPYGLLSGNKGDCDSKGVAFAAIMRNFFPQARMVMVYIPGHAFIGFNFTQGKNDQAIRINGTTYVLAEPVGPAMAPLGQVGPDSVASLRSGDYTYQEIGF